MTKQIKIPLRNLSPEKAKEFQANFPDAELVIDIGKVSPELLSESAFWQLIEKSIGINRLMSSN